MENFKKDLDKIGSSIAEEFLRGIEKKGFSYLLRLKEINDLYHQLKVLLKKHEEWSWLEKVEAEWNK